MAARSKSNALLLTRVYDAPLQAVWEAWTIPEEIAQWWGPRGFTLTSHSRDLRTGGHWHYTMHGPDGTDYENTTQYLEVVPRQRLVYDHGGHKDRPPLFRVTVLFTERNGRTQLDMSTELATPEAAQEMHEFIRKAGGYGTWDRLAEFLGQRQGKELFVIARSFNVPVERLYEMWTDPRHIAQWLPPTGSKMRFLREDMRPRVVYTQQFCDENERVIRPPFFAHWPLKMLTTVELTSEGADWSRAALQWEPVDSSAPEDIAEFVRQRGSMTMGWTGSFDKLETLLSQAGTPA